MPKLYKKLIENITLLLFTTIWLNKLWKEVGRDFVGACGAQFTTIISVNCNYTRSLQLTRDVNMKTTTLENHKLSFQYVNRLGKRFYKM